jgi:hypothetical protein
VRGAQEVRVGLARQADVVGVATATGQKALILDAANRLTDAKLCHLNALPNTLKPLIKGGGVRLGKVR